MSRTIKILISVSLAVLMCGVAYGESMPKYRMKIAGPAVDSREWLNSHPPQGEATGRRRSPRGRRRGVAGVPGALRPGAPRRAAGRLGSRRTCTTRTASRST